MSAPMFLLYIMCVNCHVSKTDNYKTRTKITIIFRILIKKLKINTVHNEVTLVLLKRLRSLTNGLIVTSLLMNDL